MTNKTTNLALYCDFENIALGVRDAQYSRFDIKEVFGGERLATFAREITKTFETIRKAPLAELADWVGEDEMQRKGEIVLVVAGAAHIEVDDAVVDNVLSVLIDELPVKQAAKIAARITGKNKNELYKAALVLKEKNA